MSINTKQIDELYRIYGFTKGKVKDKILAYTYDSGYFNNAEIICLDEHSNTKEIEKYYSDAGYACNIKNYKNIEDIHQRLFEGFFKKKNIKSKLQSEYTRFTKSQEKILKNKYTYINYSYILNGKEYTVSDKGDYSPVVEELSKIINSKEPHLVIIEAAAGYGKTCTSYELLNTIVSNENNLVPIFTELSRNRTVSKLKYVLYDEMNRNFQSVNLDLVTFEIKNGKIPLIIDGFDELITKTYDPNLKISTENDSFEDVETMLDTIGDLLEQNSKVILTSRKSAIFSGDKFDNWLNNRDKKFKVIRILIKEPSLKDWLGKEKYEVLNEDKLPYKGILNPVILSFLRSLSQEEFIKYYNDIEGIITRYFNALLEREMGRQYLTLTVGEQKQIFMNLAYEMATAYNITAETRDFIRDMILDYNKNLLLEAKLRYPLSDRPDVDSIANTLAGHVLLDRISLAGDDKNDRIGFINDFIFGTLLSDKILSTTNDNNQIFFDTKFLAIACTAYSIRSEEKRHNLFLKLKNIIELLNPMEQLDIDITLNHCLTQRYAGVHIAGITFKDFEFTKGYLFEGCTFSNCTFIDIDIYNSQFLDCIFLDCMFYNSRIYEDTLPRSPNFFGCTGLDKREGECEYENDEENYEKIVLEQFWPKGRANAQPKRSYRTLFYGVMSNEYPALDNAIKCLRDRELVEKDGDVIYLNYDKIKEIKEILGRKDYEH